MRRLLLCLINFYQRRISSGLGPRCRFHPTCSHYAQEAIEMHGTLKGFFLSLWRVLRCQPLCKGGYDPVPLGGREDSNENRSPAD
ncbi:MAG: membrane protein insertion efficiency factor YidD [Planctomycetes bacterium]|nr:membrane protein insertion efficiency factor YidD [Planctomycetota bacterium]